MKNIRVAVYQPEACEGTPSGRLDRLQAHLEKAIFPSIDLLLCPELFLSGYDIGEKIHELAESQDGASLRRVADMAAKLETALAVGYPERVGETLYNSVAVYGKSGEHLLNYRKQILPPGHEGDIFSPGNERGLFDFMGCRFAVLICYDVEFPEQVRDAALQGAEIILTPTALQTKWRFVAEKMIPTRAFENGVFLLYANHAGRERNCNYLGGSVIVGPDGRVLVSAKTGEEVIFCNLKRADLEQARKSLPYIRDVSAITKFL